MFGSANRKIIHIDMDAFYASVEQRDNPQLRNKPIAVGGGEKRGVTTTASYEARKFGVKSAMPGYLAKQKCPDLIFVPPRFDAYREVSKQIRNIFSEYTDLIEPLSLDEAYLDVTNCKKPILFATDIAMSIQERVFKETQLTCSAGVSYCKFIAKIASDIKKPNGITVVKPHQAIVFLEKLPIEKFFGVGKVTAKKMHNLGIYTGLDLKKYEKQPLIAHFGKSGGFFYDIVRGIDLRPVKSHRRRKSLAVERTLTENISEKEALFNYLLTIVDELLIRIEKYKFYCKTLTLKIKTSEFQIVTRSRSIKTSIANKEILLSLTTEIFNQFFHQFGTVRLIGLTVSNEIEKREISSNGQITFNF